MQPIYGLLLHLISHGAARSSLCCFPAALCLSNAHPMTAQNQNWFSLTAAFTSPVTGIKECSSSRFLTSNSRHKPSSKSNCSSLLFFDSTSQSCLSLLYSPCFPPSYSLWSPSNPSPQLRPPRLAHAVPDHPREFPFALKMLATRPGVNFMSAPPVMSV